MLLYHNSIELSSELVAEKLQENEGKHNFENMQKTPR